MNDQQRKRLKELSTTNISDALDFIHLKGACWGVNAMHPGCSRIAGEAVTVRLIPAGALTPRVHLGQQAIHLAKAGDIIVVDNASRLDVSCWGGVLSTAASLKGVSGVVVDGACRDIDDYVELGFSVYALGAVVASARGRVIEDDTNCTIQFRGVQVNPGDIVVADRSGVVFIPKDRFAEVLDKAYSLYEREEAMCADLRSGMDNLAVDAKYSYNTMLEK